MNYNHVLEQVCHAVEPYRNFGKSANYIPALADVNPDQFGICITTLDKEVFKAGNANVKFSIQSISKVFSLACALSYVGDEIWKRVGKEPSGTSFNSLIQLEAENGIPRNPFINAGALVVADILLSSMKSPANELISFIRTVSQTDSISYNYDVAKSEREQCYLNAAIANLLKYHKNLENNIEDVLWFYCLLCSVEMTCEELSMAFLSFADHRIQFDYNGINLSTSQVKRMNAIMQSCGFYDESGEFSFSVGLPGKSGVGGGIAALCPGRYSVTAWSPKLNEKGNSLMGMKALEELTTLTRESIF